VSSSLELAVSCYHVPHSVGDELGHRVEGADVAVLVVEEIVEVVAWNLVLNE